MKIIILLLRCVWHTIMEGHISFERCYGCGGQHICLTGMTCNSCGKEFEITKSKKDKDKNE